MPGLGYAVLGGWLQRQRQLAWRGAYAHAGRWRCCCKRLLLPSRPGQARRTQLPRTPYLLCSFQAWLHACLEHVTVSNPRLCHGACTHPTPPPFFSPTGCVCWHLLRCYKQVGKKKTNDVQFYTEVMDTVQTLDAGRRSMWVLLPRTPPSFTCPPVHPAAAGPPVGLMADLVMPGLAWAGSGSGTGALAALAALAPRGCRLLFSHAKPWPNAEPNPQKRWYSLQYKLLFKASYACCRPAPACACACRYDPDEIEEEQRERERRNSINRQFSQFVKRVQQDIWERDYG
jgi:hypothetical protein